MCSEFSVDQKISEKWHFKISELSSEFPQISCTVLYDIIIVKLGYHKFCARCIPKILLGVTQMQRIGLAIP
jgi:hypothetical protein